MKTYTYIVNANIFYSVASLAKFLECTKAHAQARINYYHKNGCPPTWKIVELGGDVNKALEATQLAITNAHSVRLTNIDRNYQGAKEQLMERLEAAKELHTASRRNAVCTKYSTDYYEWELE